MISLIGIIGSAMLAICGIPQAIQSIKTKSSAGVNSLFLWLWGLGEIFLIIYVANTTNDLILLINYLFNVLIIGVITYYKVNPKEDEYD
jgi:uncharacterized protein with PQ loop repeat